MIAGFSSNFVRLSGSPPHCGYTTRSTLFSEFPIGCPQSRAEPKIGRTAGEAALSGACRGIAADTRETPRPRVSDPDAAKPQPSPTDLTDAGILAVIDDT
ncbi:hypothetical protein QLX08_003202 [Tetragonisca angustula]|uniref:Uncharacterized protein n=1 Tax=Tetragonisca angustula TaxID=166442 RepID=A0AAW1AAT7_9HYME